MEWQTVNPFAGLVCQSATMVARCHVCAQDRDVEIRQGTYAPELVRVEGGPAGGEIEDVLRAALETQKTVGFQVRCLTCRSTLPPCVPITANIVLPLPPRRVIFRAEVMAP